MQKVLIVLLLPFMLLAKGKIGVTSNMKGADIYVDGVKKGVVKEGYTDIVVKRGERIVRISGLREDGKGKYSGEAKVNVRKNSYTKINIRIKKVITEKIKQRVVQKEIKKEPAKDYNKDRFERTSQDVVYDKKLKLSWQDNEAVKHLKKSWSEARRYCEALNLGGFSDWRLPSIKELSSITQMNTYAPAISEQFKNISKDKYNYYWSSTTYASNSSDVWVIFFNRGNVDWLDKSSAYFVRCVR